MRKGRNKIDATTPTTPAVQAAAKKLAPMPPHNLFSCLP